MENEANHKKLGKMRHTSSIRLSDAKKKKKKNPKELC